jgi:hypothetical protein
MKTPKRTMTVSPAKGSVALASVVSAVDVGPTPTTGVSSSSQASPPSAYTNATDS